MQKSFAALSSERDLKQGSSLNISLYSTESTAATLVLLLRHQSNEQTNKYYKVLLTLTLKKNVQKKKRFLPKPLLKCSGADGSQGKMKKEKKKT